MNPLIEPKRLADSPTVDANRAQATQELLRQAPQKDKGSQHLLRARLHAMVLRDDAPLLRNNMQEMRKDWDADRMAQELWYFALLEGKPRTFEVLCELSKDKAFKFSTTNALDNMPQAFQLWVLDIPLARNMWLSQTEPLSARSGYRVVNGLKFLEDNQSSKDLHATLDAKPDAFHARMRLFIADFGMQTLMKNGAFLHTIAYYQEPSKKHLRVAATGTHPVYDITRMEAYWPGVESVLVALAGLGLTPSECEEQVRKIVSNKYAGAAQKSPSMQLPSDFLPG